MVTHLLTKFQILLVLQAVNVSLCLIVQPVQNYTDCYVQMPALIGNGQCDNFVPYNTPICGEDGGDCSAFNKAFPGCEAPRPELVGDGSCQNVFPYNTDACKNDGGDCIAFRSIYPDCFVIETNWIGDGQCQDFAPYNSKACGFDGGDCNIAKKRDMSDRNVGISAFSVMGLVILVAIGTYLHKKRNERLTRTSPAASEPEVELGNNHDSKPQARDVDEEGNSGCIDVIDLSLEKGENVGDIEEGTNVDIQMPIALSDDESHNHSSSDVDEGEDIDVNASSVQNEKDSGEIRKEVSSSLFEEDVEQFLKPQVRAVDEDGNSGGIDVIDLGVLNLEENRKNADDVEEANVQSSSNVNEAEDIDVNVSSVQNEKDSGEIREEVSSSSSEDEEQIEEKAIGDLYSKVAGEALATLSSEEDEDDEEEEINAFFSKIAAEAIALEKLKGLPGHEVAGKRYVQMDHDSDGDESNDEGILETIDLDTDPTSEEEESRTIDLGADLTSAKEGCPKSEGEDLMRFSVSSDEFDNKSPPKQSDIEDALKSLEDEYEEFSKINSSFNDDSSNCENADAPASPLVPIVLNTSSEGTNDTDSTANAGNLTPSQKSSTEEEETKNQPYRLLSTLINRHRKRVLTLKRGGTAETEASRTETETNEKKLTSIPTSTSTSARPKAEATQAENFLDKSSSSSSEFEGFSDIDEDAFV